MLAALLAAAVAAAGSPALVATAAPEPPATTVPKPPITAWPIPYGATRRHDMATYSRRHYGVRAWRLRNPKVIVEHIAVASTARAVWSTFAPNRPDVELHEKPGVCSHYVINARGAIFRLVNPSIRCRHTVGLNDRAIGIEHVGFRDGDLLGRRAELRASLRLTRYLRCRYGIEPKDVIGHAESLSSPYHHERVARLQRQTHADMRHASMVTYRRKLQALGRCPG